VTTFFFFPYPASPFRMRRGLLQAVAFFAGMVWVLLPMEVSSSVCQRMSLGLANGNRPDRLLMYEGGTDGR
jgi:hypothetical protein